MVDLAHAVLARVAVHLYRQSCCYHALDHGDCCSHLDRQSWGCHHRGCCCCDLCRHRAPAGCNCVAGSSCAPNCHDRVRVRANYLGGPIPQTPYRSRLLHSTLIARHRWSLHVSFEVHSTVCGLIPTGHSTWHSTRITDCQKCGRGAWEHTTLDVGSMIRDRRCFRTL